MPKKDKALYMAIHHWLSFNFGKPEICENKKCLGIGKRYEWALKKDKGYDFKRNNFIRLCASCHRKYDLTEEMREKIGTSSWNHKKTHCKHGHLFDFKNTILTEKYAWDGRATVCRSCRACKLRGQKEYKLRKKQKLL